ncbi:hypothetical protein ACFQDG_10910 [Natronoarchaeum mannanilyticum]|uniref:Zinc ribbon domain-containing protein n=1 Tax=Natronoarchaeum mannanilyticum TaxID=926360 RepID=A0AAV3T7V6_9EURY
MRYCHHCGAEVGPQAEVCDECDGDLFEPPEDLRADLEEVADADDAEDDAAEEADPEVADVEDSEPDVDAAAADGADTVSEGDADDEADAAAGDDGDEGHGRVDSLFSSDESTADASDDDQGFVAKIKGLFR